MSDDNLVARNFLTHLIMLIKDNMGKQSPISKAADRFEEGKALAYHEVADFIIECSRVFNLPLVELGITEFNADDLI